MTLGVNVVFAIFAMLNLKQGSKQNLYVEKLSMNVEVWEMFLEELIIDQSIIKVYLQSHTSFEGFDHGSRHQLS